MACVALIVLALPALVLVAVTAQPASADDLRQSASTTFVLDPAAAAVHVAIDMTVTNTAQDQRHGNVIEQAYFSTLHLGTLAEATNFSAVNGSGTNLSVTTEPGSVERTQEIVIHLSPRLFSNQTQVIHLRYDLPSGAPRSKAFTRVTPAFSVFEAFGTGDPGAGSVTIVVPKSFTVEVVGEDMDKRATGETVTYTAPAISDPYAWFASVSARDDSKLAKKTLSIGGRSIRLRAFPAYPEWSRFVERAATSGIPALAKLVGLPMPWGNQLVVTESVTPYLYGYAGWFSRDDNTIEIGDDLDPQVVLHEISHTWFNETLFSERWIDEGLAQEYASRAVALTGGKLVAPERVNQRDRGAVPLEEWSSVNLQDDISRDRETYGYNASWWVIRAVTNEIGIDRMRRVLAAAAKHEIPYPGGGNTASQGVTWMRFLDYLDETGGSRRADALFRTYVARDSDQDSFAKRTHARTAYARLVSESGWQAPLVLREAMTDWSFAAAERHIRVAESVTTTRDAIEKTVRPIGLHSPASLRDAYQDEGSNLDTVLKTANREFDVAKELVAATNAVNGSHGLLAKIGLIGAKHHTNLANARKQFTAGNAEEARSAALSAERTVADAGTAGTLRVGVALGVGVLAAFIVWVLRRRARNRRARRAAAVEQEHGPENEEVTSSPAG